MSGKRQNGISPVCSSCDARHRGICGTLNADQLVALSKLAHRSVAEEGDELIGDAAHVDSYANLLSGVVKLTKSLSDGRQQIVGLQFAPDFLGRPFRSESAISAQALTSVAICSFPRMTVERLIREQPDLENRLLRKALDDLDDARDWMVTLGRKTAVERVASLLLLIARNVDPRAIESGGATAFYLPLTRLDIADFLGLTIETVSRQLTRLRRENVIRIENNRRVIVDSLARLEGCCGN